MKNENEQIRGLFEVLSPDTEQLERMEKRITGGSKTASHRRIKPAVLIAAVLMIAAGVTAVSASPALQRYFFPDAGVVELEENAEPLYLMLDTEAGSRLKYGYWYNGAAQFWIESQQRYEEADTEILMPDAVGEVELLSVMSGSIGGKLLQQYRVTVSDISAEDAMNGFTFDGSSVHFSQLPSQYHPYTMENSCIRLTLIPLTEDLTTFAAEAEYTDGRGEIELSDHYVYYMDDYTAVNAPPMILITEDGHEYALSEIGEDNIFTLEDKPSSRIIGFRSDALSLASCTSDNVTVTVELPSDGDAAVTELEFTFPDQSKGRIYAVGYNDPIVDTQMIDRSTEFPMGYLSVITDVVEQDGIRYWYSVRYTEEFEEHMSQYYENSVQSPYDLADIPPMSPKTRVSSDGLNDQMHYTFHYIPDGAPTVDLVIDRYTALADGKWHIDFD